MAEWENCYRLEVVRREKAKTAEAHYQTWVAVERIISGGIYSHQVVVVVVGEEE
jgi:hypothetical protein